MRVLFLLALALVVGTFWPSAHAAGPSPSFRCAASNSEVERVVCGDPLLAAEDSLMARLYGLAQRSTFGVGPSNEPAAQRKWLKDREICGQADAQTRTCLAAAYRARNERLALAILFTRPEIALPELRRLDPGAAPMFEAIYLFARAPRLAEADRDRIRPLLASYELNPGGWGTAAEAITSDAAFAEFVGVRSASIPGERDGRAFPCAATLRKPMLIAATGAHFGSSMDNWVIGSDCGERLPPLPKFEALVQKRLDGMTDCGGGTIRYAYYRSFLNTALAARLATAAQLRKAKERSFPRRRGVRSVDVATAVDELAGFYVKYGRAPASQARSLARQMVFATLDEAWQC